ncbi:MAG: zinc ribbon domain-containing protein [Candidatus Dadabacteria bacterium]|nr:MAG: zinc ribbon domain-containing protein [Candidatus Dadabacteria bacterium]
MAIYEYECPECGVFEVQQKITEPALKECPKCAKKGKKNQVKRLISLSAFHLKGSGWYKTDYGSNGTQKQSKGAKSEESKKEEKSNKSEKSVNNSCSRPGGCLCKDNT